METEKFERFVEEELAQLPEKFKNLIENLVFIVEEKPSREIYERTGSSPFSVLLGHYHGVPLKHRGPFYGNTPPDVIVIYKKSIESVCSTDNQIRKKIREVIKHEIGHYFGLSDTEMRDIEDH